MADYFVQMRKNNDYVASKEEMEHVDAVLKLMSVLTQDERFYEAQNYLTGSVTQRALLFQTCPHI